MRLTILVYPDGQDAPVCSELSLDAVSSLDAPFTDTWQRDAGMERRLEFPSVVADRLTVIAIAEDDQGMPIQFGCSEIDYADIESPEDTLRLSMRS